MNRAKLNLSLLVAVVLACLLLIQPIGCRPATTAEVKDESNGSAAPAITAAPVEAGLQSGSDESAPAPPSAPRSEGARTSPDPGDPGLNQAMIEAVIARDEDRAIDLLRSGASPVATNDRGVPVLFLACQISMPRLVRLLLEQGADPNTRHRDGGLPIHWAARARWIDLEVIETLLDFGADINASMLMQGRPIRAIDFARNAGNDELVRLLVSRGAEP